MLCKTLHTYINCSRTQITTLFQVNFYGKEYSSSLNIHPLADSTMFSLRTIALKHVSSQHPIKCNTVAFDVISYILLLSLPVKGQVLPDEEMDHPTQVQLQNLKQPVRDVEIKNNSPVSWSCFPSGSRLSDFCFFTNPERRNCSGWGALQCNKGGLKLPLSTVGGTTQNLRNHISGYRCAVPKIVHP